MIDDHFCTVAVFSPKIGLGVVSVTYPLPSQDACLKCHNCEQHQLSCRHVQLVKENIGELEVLEEIRMYLELEKNVPVREQYIPICNNKGKFPFFKSNSYSSNMKELCDCGYKWDIVDTERIIPVFSRNTYTDEKGNKIQNF